MIGRCLAALVLAGTLTGPAVVRAQDRPAPDEAYLITTADREAATIGDPINITARLVVPPGVEVRSFEPEAAFEALTILERGSEPRREREDGNFELIRRFRIAAYDLDAIELPVVEATLAAEDGREFKVRSAPLTIRIASILPEEQSEPADIKGPVFMPVARIWPWLLLGLLPIAALAWWLWKRRRSAEPDLAAAPAGPPRPEHELAYEELERLLSSGLLEKGGLKEFYIELAEILKRYFAARFGIDTFERTTYEILEGLRGRRVSVKVKATAVEFFVACDLVKFARHHPDADGTRETVERAYRLIDGTRRAPEPAAESAGPAAALLQGGGAAGGGAR